MSQPGFRGPLFLVGLPRSGTKLLRGLLNEHSRIGIPDAETEFLPDWVRRWGTWGDLSRPEVFRAFAERQRGSAYFTYLAQEQGYAVEADRWFASCRGFDAASVFEALVRLDAGVPFEGDGVWGDKSPGYVAHLPLLWRLWPRARVVHIVRDARDYALSMRKAWNKHMLRAAQRWADGIGRARADAAACADRYLEMRYEDLLDRPEAELRRVCGFLGLEFEAGMTRLSRATENLGAAAGQVGIKRDNAGRHRTEMDDRTRERIEEIAGPALRSLGYPVGYEGPVRRVPGPFMVAWQVRDGAFLVRSDVELRGWVGAARFRWRLFRETGGVEGWGRG